MWYKAKKNFFWNSTSWHSFNREYYQWEYGNIHLILKSINIIIPNKFQTRKRKKLSQKYLIPKQKPKSLHQNRDVLEHIKWLINGCPVKWTKYSLSQKFIKY